MQNSVPYSEPSGTTDSPSAEVSLGAQATVQMEIYYTKENGALIDSYLGNTASGNDAAAAEDLQKIYNASSATVQTNVVGSSESKFVDFDSGFASVKVGASTVETTNVSTDYKAPHSRDYEKIN